MGCVLFVKTATVMPRHLLKTVDRRPPPNTHTFQETGQDAAWHMEVDTRIKEERKQLAEERENITLSKHL